MVILPKKFGIGISKFLQNSEIPKLLTVGRLGHHRGEWVRSSAQIPDQFSHSACVTRGSIHLITKGPNLQKSNSRLTTQIWVRRSWTTKKKSVQKKKSRDVHWIRGSASLLDNPRENFTHRCPNCFGSKCTKSIMHQTSFQKSLSWIHQKRKKKIESWKKVEPVETCFEYSEKKLKKSKLR